MTKDEALRLALWALDSVLANHKGAPVLPWIEARDSIKAALEAKDEPAVCRFCQDPTNYGAKYFNTRCADCMRRLTEPRTWVGLTDEDRLELAKAQHGWEDLLIAAEAKLKERNT